MTKIEVWNGESVDTVETEIDRITVTKFSSGKTLMKIYVKTMKGLELIADSMKKGILHYRDVREMYFIYVDEARLEFFVGGKE